MQVFILAGQSNMEGAGQIKADPKRNSGRGSLECLVKDPATAKHFAPLVDSAGQWRTRDDVWISYLDRKGPLTVGFGARKDETIGPESRQETGRRGGAGMYGDFTMMVDAEIGRILAALDKRGLAEDTLVIFTSDNGPTWYEADVERLGPASVGGLRGMKSDAWEGGHRMPFIVRWPGRVKAGTVSEQTICFTDLLPTFAETVLTDGKKTYSTPSVKVSNVSRGKAGLWLFQIGERQEYGHFEFPQRPLLRRSLRSMSFFKRVTTQSLLVAASRYATGSTFISATRRRLVSLSAMRPMWRKSD